MARTMQGTVVSDAADKTIVVATTQRKAHPLYSKQYTITNKLSVHDEKNEAKIGDVVSIVEARRTSKHKSWALQRVVERAEGGV